MSAATITTGTTTLEHRDWCAGGHTSADTCISRPQTFYDLRRFDGEDGYLTACLVEVDGAVRVELSIDDEPGVNLPLGEVRRLADHLVKLDRQGDPNPAGMLERVAALAVEVGRPFDAADLAQGYYHCLGALARGGAQRFVKATR